MKPTTGNLGPRDAGPHGITLAMLAVERPATEYVKQYETQAVKMGGVAFERRVGDWSPYTKDGKTRTKGTASKSRRRRTRARVLRRLHPHPWREALTAAKAGRAT